MKITIHEKYKSIHKNTTFTLPDFSILTGKNGSGKSQILEAIKTDEISKTSIDSVATPYIYHIPYNGLNNGFDITDTCTTQQITEQVENIWRQVDSIIANYKNTTKDYKDPIASKQHILNHAENDNIYQTIKKIIEATGKPLHEITHEDIAMNASLTNSMSYNMFVATQLAPLIKIYHYRLHKNELMELREYKNKSTTRTALTDSEFVGKYGPPPWELINEVLEMANLTYKISEPDTNNYDTTYFMYLTDTNTNTKIKFNELSSGERTIMSLAMAVYIASEGGRLPDLLLLDEPDASLHPEFSKLLIEILTKTIVEKVGIRVLMTTHSPSTVAMAPENCIFEIDRISRTPTSVSNYHALRTLTNGTTYLNVSFEKRRQIFVESKYDVKYYQKLFNIVSRKEKYSFQPIFLEPHNGSSNCTDVKNIVTKLREVGNDLVYGIIDYDTSNKPENAIVILGGNNRYAIDNYIIEPIYVCLSLIKNKKKNYSDFGVTGDKTTYIDATDLSQQECQNMVDSFLSKLGLPLEDLYSSELKNGYKINYPKSFLLHHGHSYEAKVKQQFVELNSIFKGQNESALKLAILNTIEDFPQYLPIEIYQTFDKLLNTDI